MSVEDNLQFVRELEKVVNARDWTRFDELHAESVVDYSPTTPEGRKGIEAHRENLQGIFKAFPDGRVELTNLIGQGDWICTEFTMTGTHTGPLPGPEGEEIPATNKPLQLRFCGTAKIEGGKITEEHNYFDQLGMLAQLGLVPEGD